MGKFLAGGRDGRVDVDSRGAGDAPDCPMTTTSTCLEGNTMSLQTRTSIDDLMEFPPNVTSLLRQNDVSRLLHPAGARRVLSKIELLELASGIGEAIAVDRPIAGLVGRRYSKMFRSASVEAWLIAWGASTYLGLHDHGGSRAAYHVVAGELVEASASLISRDPLSTIHLPEGSRKTLGDSEVHELWNPTPEIALSVHVYSPPLETMGFYSDAETNYLEKVRTETEHEWPGSDYAVDAIIGA
jgi:hypothetical protein